MSAIIYAEREVEQQKATWLHLKDPVSYLSV